MNNSNEILFKMNSLLEEASMIKKEASADDEIKGLASSLLHVSDYLDTIGEKEASFFIDEALSILASDDITINHVDISDVSNISTDIITKASISTLLRLSDRFDELNKQSVSDNIDMALTILS